MKTIGISGTFGVQAGEDVSDDILAKLAFPFPVESVSWRVGSTSQDKKRGLALAYIDARDVQDRLNQVCGLDWQVRHPWALGTKLACEIGIRINGEWLWRGDGAGDSDIEAEKGAFSDSFKRAAVRWGVGRYLYDLDSPWVDLKAVGKSFVIADHEYANLRKLLGGKTQHRTEPESTPERPKSDIKIEAEKIASNLKSAKTLEEMDRILDNAMELRNKFPQVTNNYLNGLYEKRRRAMAEGI